MLLADACCDRHAPLFGKVSKKNSTHVSIGDAAAVKLDTAVGVERASGLRELVAEAAGDERGQCRRVIDRAATNVSASREHLLAAAAVTEDA